MALTKSELNTRAKTKRKEKGREKPTRFDTCRFIAIDGEGFNTAEQKSITIAASRKDKPATTHTAHDHHYALIMNSEGDEIYAPDGRLTGEQCLSFLCDTQTNNPDGVLCVFAGGYDITHMLGFSLDRFNVAYLLDAQNPYIDVTMGDWDFRIAYRPRKSLQVWRFVKGADKYVQHEARNGKKTWKLEPESRATLWDVWGFFQGKFTGALQTWLPNDPDAKFIAEMKDKRSLFKRDQIDEIRKYTRMELRCLVDIMNKVRDSIAALGLKITRWDGAGAIAKAMYRKHDVYAHMAKTPDDVFQAAQCAYSGGHIEANKIGHHEGAIHHYDITSAYPHHFRRMPSLTSGHWKNGIGDPIKAECGDFTLVYIEFHFFVNKYFYPLFHRTEAGSILYPSKGAGWYWMDEYRAALAYSKQYGCETFRAVEFKTFRQTPAQSAERPFTWIEDMFNERKRIIAETRATGIPNGAEHTIKLGINSCYGATAQQVGARNGEAPPSFQLEWAGFVTAGCRAQLMMAAIQNRTAIISFATDAIYSLEPLSLNCPSSKVLGTWEYTKHAGMTIVMPGVYWTHDDETIKETGVIIRKSNHYSRGFDKRQMSEIGHVLRAWKDHRENMPITQDRMITLGNAKMSDNFWELRGLFVTSARTLAMNGANSKRHAINVQKHSPHLRLIQTEPQSIMCHYDTPFDDLKSRPYPIGWLEPEKTSDDVPHSDAAFFVAKPNVRASLTLKPFAERQNVFDTREGYDAAFYR